MLKELTTRYAPGARVERGLYWNQRSWEFADIPEEGGQLPEGKHPYHRIPVLLAIASAPVVGLGFILFLPLAVPPVLLYAAGKAVARKLARRRAPIPAETSPVS